MLPDLGRQTLAAYNSQAKQSRTEQQEADRFRNDLERVGNGSRGGCVCHLIGRRIATGVGQQGKGRSADGKRDVSTDGEFGQNRGAVDR